MTLVKICGVRDVETALAAAEAGADFVGMIFAESRRQVTPEACHEMVEALRARRSSEGPARFDGPKLGDVRGSGWFAAWSEAIADSLPRWRPIIVGVFADQPADAVNDIAEAAGLDMVQLSGGEDDDFIREIRLPVLRTIHVHPDTTADDIIHTATPGAGHALHLDKGAAHARGGTGEAFDWGIAGEAARRVPIMLAGGLTAETVAEAIQRTAPWAVDVSSGVETDGVKDIDKVRTFVRAAKGVRI